MGWKAIVSSATGTSHENGKIPCQDYGDYVMFEDIIVGAVADGAGSAKLSHIGAKSAVNKAIDYLKGWYNWRKNEKELDWHQQISHDKAYKVFNATLKKVIDDLNQEKSNNSCSINDLACTLLVFFATPEWIAAMQVGDGFIVVRQHDSEYQLLFHPDKGEYANETTFVTSANAQSQMRVNVLTGHYKFICASTDGLERLAISTRDWTPSPAFFQPFEEGLITRTKQEEQESLKQWLDSKEVNARTDDDKTMLLCVYEPSVGDEESQEPSGDSKNNVHRSLYSKTVNLVGLNLQLNLVLVSQTFLCNLLAGCFLQVNHDLVAFVDNGNGLTAAVSILFMVLCMIFLSLCLTLAQVVVTYPKNRKKARFIRIIIGIFMMGVCLAGLLLGRYFYLSISLDNFS